MRTDYRFNRSARSTSVDPRIPEDVLDRLRSHGHAIHIIGDNQVQGGFASFASPVAILRDPDADFSAGVDTFHSAHALGL